MTPAKRAAYQALIGMPASALSLTWKCPEVIVEDYQGSVSELLDELDRLEAESAELRQALAATWDAADAVYDDVSSAGHAGLFDDVMDRCRGIIEKACFVSHDADGCVSPPESASNVNALRE